MDYELRMSNDNIKRDIDSITPDSSLFGATALFSLELLTDSGLGDDHAYLQKAIDSLTLRPGKLDMEAVVVMDDALQTNPFNGSTCINLQECLQSGEQQRPENNGEGGKGSLEKGNQPSFSCGAASTDCASPSFNETPLLSNYIGTQQNNTLSLASYSLSSDPMRGLSTSETRCPDVPVYASIVTSSLKGRALDFRTFLTKKQVSSSTLKEHSVGVFVGQLPSTYTEEDTAALLRAIGADAGVEVHVRDVKSHNQRHTCAFVITNSSALPVLLGYSKRVLCDVSCVWVVEPAQASQLKDYIYGFMRDHLRGVPKAALVLEELTPQCMRSRSSCPKGTRVFDGNEDSLCSASSSFLFASQTGSPLFVSHQAPMNMVLQGWKSMDMSSVPFNAIAGNLGGSQTTNPVSAHNIQGISPANVFAAPQSASVISPAPQVNYYIIGASQNGFQQCPPGHVNSHPSAAAVPAVNGGARTGFSTFGMDAQSHFRCAPPCSSSVESGKSHCSLCLSLVAATEGLYVSSYDKNVVTCMRCAAQQGFAGNGVQVAMGMSPCMISLGGMNNISYVPPGNSQMLVQTFSPHSPQLNSRPQLLTPTQFPPPPLPLYQQ